LDRDGSTRTFERLRRRLSRARDAVFYAVPPRWRGGVAAVLPARLAPPLTKPVAVEQFYDAGGDPFGFDVNPDEQIKFHRTLEVCGEGNLGRVLEIGCAVGSLTELLATRASHVLAIDISSAAIAQVKQRLSHLPNVQPETRTLPRQFPEGHFDLIIASDVLYYLSLDELRLCLVQIEAALSPGGALVAVDYTRRVGTLIDGNELHDFLAENATMAHTFEERTELGAGRPYRIDRYEKS